MQSQKCERCQSGGVVEQCTECSQRLCLACKASEKQHASCVAKRSLPPPMCGVCKNRVDGQTFGYNLGKCVGCHTCVCEGCSKLLWVNQSNSRFCLRCRRRPFLFTCTRCLRPVEEEKDRYFCDLCAGVLCRECLPASFECGVIKCRACCSAPIRICNLPPIFTVLYDETKVMIGKLLHHERVEKLSPTLSPQPSRYEKLYHRVKLGGGGQGVVYKCTTKDDEVVVLKEMSFPQSSQEIFEARLHQAKKMRKLSHQHLIRYLDVFGSRDPFKISVVMPYYSEGDLNRFVRRQKAPIEEHKLCSIILQIACALEYLSSQQPPLTHCDIKPENILLLSKEEQVLLMDLDLCRSFEVQPSNTGRVLNQGEEVSPTLEYRAPELARSVGSPKSDIFSLGVVAFVLATLPEFAMLTNSKGVTMVLSNSDWTTDSLSMGVRKAILSHTRKYSGALIELIIKMLLHDPNERPEAATVCFELTYIMEKRLLETGR